MKSNYLQKMTEEPLWRIMRNRKHAEQKHKRENSESVCTRNLIGSLRTPVRFPILPTRA